MELGQMSDRDLSRAYARVETWRTSTMEAECKRMYQLQEMGAELQRRGLPMPEPVYDDEEL